MTLASMLAIDRNALICDLAETYQIYDYRSLPAHLVATFSAGLRENSRIQKKIRGEKLSYEQSLLAMIYDILAGYMWSGEGDPPVRMMDYLNSVEPKKKEKTVQAYNSPNDFDAEWRRMIGGGITCQEQT